jgi:outer membrane receptor protein involved in Fe transport
MHRNLIGSFAAACSIAALVCAAPAHAQLADEFHFSLPAQDLSISLREVSLRTGRSIVAPSELVRGRQAPAVSGPFTAEGAVRILLTGSGLDVRRVGESLVIYRPGEGERLAEAESPPEGAEDKEIVVTGTNIRGAQPTAPVIVIRRPEIDASGTTSVEQLMAKVPQNAQSGVNRENFRAVGAGADPTEHGSGLNLRGLGQRATLVLIDGRRIAPSNTGAFVDVSLIPLSAVERVEILTDGASAIYGSDAVGGVVNFLLRDDFEGVETLFQVGSATEGDGDVLQAGITGGTAWGSGRALLSYEFRAEDEIATEDRDFTINLAPGTSLLPRERRHSLFGNLSQSLSDDLTVEVRAILGTRDTTRAYFLTGSPIPVRLDAEADTASLSAAAEYRIGGDWVAQLTGGYGRTSTDQRQEQPGGSGLVNDRSTANRIWDLSLKADGSLFRLPGGPVRIALGVEGRRETYHEDFRSPFIDLTIDQSRDVLAGFAEVQVPIFSAENRRFGFERLIVTAAGRYERYDGFGSTFNPKLGLLWSPVRGLSLRTSYDTSFRAPLLSETAGAYSAIYLPPEIVFIDPAQATGVALALGGANPEVGPERSRSWTVGAELAPPSLPGLSASVNYYSIRFSDRIALPSQIITVVGDPAFESIVTRDPDDELVRQLIAGAQVRLDFSGPGFSNGNATPADVSVIVDGRVNNTAETKTDGLDFNLSYRFSAGRNRFLLGANANLIFSFTDQLRPTSLLIDALDSPYRPLDFRARTQLGWNRGGWSSNLFVNHADNYRDDRGNRDLPISSFTTVDLSIAWQAADDAPRWLRGTRVALAAENLLDSGPPRLLPDPGSTAGLGYDPVNATARGRFISFQMRRTW